MKYFSTFSGIGGFELGIQQAYESLCDADGSQNRRSQEDTERDKGQGLFTKKGENVGSTERPISERSTDFFNKRPLCVGYSEIDKYAIQIYEKHFPEHKNYGDITGIKPETLPDFDLFVGGVPCQSWSIAGKRGGFDDERGNMWFQCTKILRAKQPKFFLFENVKGLLSHDGGKSMERICEELCDCGYAIDFEVLNSKNFDVPQNRERIYIIAFLDSNVDFKFPNRSKKKTRLGDILESNVDDKYTLSDRLWAGHQRRKKEHEEKGNGFGYCIFDDNSEYTSTMSARYYKDGSEILIKQEGKNPRKLTPTECERLQGFPDGWTEGVSDTQRYKTLGNAVTVNVVRDICLQLLRTKQRDVNNT